MPTDHPVNSEVLVVLVVSLGLCLSGHTHGGQWGVPSLTEGVFKRAGQPWYRGLCSVRGNHRYVNRGWASGAAPELPLITLHRLEPT